MNYIWELALRALEQKADFEKVTLKTGQPFIAGKELCFDHINQPDVPRIVEVNPYYRYQNIFKELIQADKEVLNGFVEYFNDVIDIPNMKLIHILNNETQLVLFEKARSAFSYDGDSEDDRRISRKIWYISHQKVRDILNKDINSGLNKEIKRQGSSNAFSNEFKNILDQKIDKIINEGTKAALSEALNRDVFEMKVRDVLSISMLEAIHGHVKNVVSVPFQDALVDIILHFLAKMDLKVGINRREYYIMFMIKDMEEGRFGNFIAQHINVFNRREQKILANNLLFLYEAGEYIHLLKDAVSRVFKGSYLFSNFREKDEIILYLRTIKTPEKEMKIEIITRLFLSLKYQVLVYWENMFGIIGVNELMRMNNETGIMNY